MKTYQDLINVGDNEKKRIDFVREAINEHKGTTTYKTALAGESYYKHRNATINEFKKILYNVSGEAIEDIWGANYKMACRHFNRFITQENQYLLGNGVTWENKTTADKLGTRREPFDNKLQEAGEKALWGGVSFGFYNLDHIDVFSILEFVPLYDEENGSLRAGIRFWQIDNTKPLRAVLYEESGYTQYMWYKQSFTPSDKWEKVESGISMIPQRPYVINYKETEADGIIIVDGDNYPSFPIVPLWANPERQSEIVGIREQIDAYDLIKSGFANTVDDASMIYWTIQGAGGMDDEDLEKFIEQIKMIKAVNLPPDVTAQANTINLPYQSSEALLDRIDKDLYRDAMALDTENIANGATTATQIRAAYEPLNAKCDRYEYCVLDFIYAILDLAGIEDEPTFTRSMIVNVNETVQALIQASGVLPQDYIAEKIVTIFGDGDRSEEILNDIEADNYQRFDTEQTIEAETEEVEESGEDDALAQYGAEVEAMLNELLEELNA